MSDARTAWLLAFARARSGSTVTARSASVCHLEGTSRAGMAGKNGLESIKEYTQVKSVWVELTGATRDPVRLG